MTTLRALCITLISTVAAQAQISATVDLLSPGEPGYDALPTGRAIVDCFVDLPLTDDWTFGGMRVETHNTGTFVYARNLSGEIILVNPGLGQQYTTFLSRPRARNAAARFENGGATAGGPSTDPMLLDVAWSSVPVPPGDTGGAGYVARIAIDLGDFVDRRDFLQLSLGPPDPSATILASCTRPGSPFGWQNATFDVPQLSGINWYLFDPGITPGDLDGDGDVDIADLAQLLANFGMSGATYEDGDIDGDGDVDIADLAILLGNFGA